MKITKSKVECFIDYLEGNFGYSIYEAILTKTCKNCGYYTENVSSIYCPICGKKLPAAEEDPPRQIRIAEIKEALYAVFKKKL